MFEVDESKIYIKRKMSGNHATFQLGTDEIMFASHEICLQQVVEIETLLNDAYKFMNHGSHLSPHHYTKCVIIETRKWVHRI